MVVGGEKWEQDGPKEYCPTREKYSRSQFLVPLSSLLRGY